MGIGDESRDREEVEGREGELKGMMKGTEGIPGGPVGGEGTRGEAIKDGGLGLKVEALECWVYVRMVSENGGTGVG